MSRGQPGAAALHKKYPAGNQTPAQLAAERANLSKARLARGQSRHTLSHPYQGFRPSTPKTRGTLGARRAQTQYILSPYFHTRPFGVRYLMYKKTIKLSISFTGRNMAFRPRVGTERYMSRTKWGVSSTHKFKRRLTHRQKRSKQLLHWRATRHRVTPR